MTNVILPGNTFVDLYAATGIAVGTPINVINITPQDVGLFSTELAPNPSDDKVNLSYGPMSFTNDSGDLGAWGVCIGFGGAVDVKEVS